MIAGLQLCLCQLIKIGIRNPTNSLTFDNISLSSMKYLQETNENHLNWSSFLQIKRTFLVATFFGGREKLLPCQIVKKKESKKETSKITTIPRETKMKIILNLTQLSKT